MKKLEINNDTEELNEDTDNNRVEDIKEKPIFKNLWEWKPNW